MYAYFTKYSFRFATIQQNYEIHRYEPISFVNVSYLITTATIKQNLFSDIGANLTDGMFRGIYNGTQKHPDDLDIVLERSWNTGLEKIIITVGTITDTEDVAKIAQKDGIN